MAENDLDKVCLAADSLAKSGTPEPVGPGELWHKKDPSFRLPYYIQHIANDLKENGHSESQAIAIAVGTVKRWAGGGGHVDSNTRAAASKAASEWETLKARAHAKLAAESPLDLLRLTELDVAYMPHSDLDDLMLLSDNTSDSDNDDDSQEPNDEPDEDRDNDDMQQSGVSMGSGGVANYGSVVLGHVLKAPKAAGYRGVHHDTGLKTPVHQTRAKAAMALLALHHVMKNRKAY
jgi:hypothetical protein